MSQLRTISKSAAKTRFTDGTQATDREKIFTGHASDKRLESNGPVRTGAENMKSMKGHSRKGRRCRGPRRCRTAPSRRGVGSAAATTSPYAGRQSRANQPATAPDAGAQLRRHRCGGGERARAPGGSGAGTGGDVQGL